MQFAISELRPLVAKEALVTEPRAGKGPRAGSPRGVVVATGSKHSTVYYRFLCGRNCRLQVECRIRSLPRLCKNSVE